MGRGGSWGGGDVGLARIRDASNIACERCDLAEGPPLYLLGRRREGE